MKHERTGIVKYEECVYDCTGGITMPEYPTNPIYSARQHNDLAGFIKESLAKALPDSLVTESKRRVAERLADRFAADSPQFDRERFLEACGLEPTE